MGKPSALSHILLSPIVLIEIHLVSLSPVSHGNPTSIWQNNFRTRKVEKTYHVSSQEYRSHENESSTPPVWMDTGRTDEAKVMVDPRGQSAETSYTVLKLSQKDWSLVELHPKTGRTHQTASIWPISVIRLSAIDATTDPAWLVSQN